MARPSASSDSEQATEDGTANSEQTQTASSTRASTPSQLHTPSVARKRKPDCELQQLIDAMQKTREKEMKALMESFAAQQQIFANSMTGIFNNFFQNMQQPPSQTFPTSMFQTNQAQHVQSVTNAAQFCSPPVTMFQAPQVLPSSGFTAPPLPNDSAALGRSVSTALTTDNSTTGSYCELSTVPASTASRWDGLSRYTVTDIDD